jgi:hypothetical protein
MMRKFLLFAITGFLIFGAKLSLAQNQANDLNCFTKYENAFKERGSYTISDNIYRNVMISFFEGEDVYCVRGKVRVENGYVSAIFYYYDDNTEELYDKKFHNLNNEPPTVSNGISEMIVNADREKFRVVFIDKLKPKRKSMQQMTVPDDL